MTQNTKYNFALKEAIYNSGYRQRYIAGLMGYKSEAFSARLTRMGRYQFTDKEQKFLAEFLKVKQEDIFKQEAQT